MCITLLKGVVIGCEVDCQVGLLVIKKIWKLLPQLYLKPSLLLYKPNFEISLLNANNANNKSLHPIALIPNNNRILLIDNILMTRCRRQLASLIPFIIQIKNDIMSINYNLISIIIFNLFLKKDLFLIIYFSLNYIVFDLIKYHMIFYILIF